MYWERIRTPISGCSGPQRAAAATSPSSVWVGGILMSTIAGVGLGASDAAEQGLGVLRLCDHFDAHLVEEPHDPLTGQHDVVCDDYAHGSSDAESRGLDLHDTSQRPDTVGHPLERRLGALHAVVFQG